MFVCSLYGTSIHLPIFSFYHSFILSLTLLFIFLIPSFVCLLIARYFYEFLLAHHRQVAREIRDEYVDTMSKIYFSYFREYISKLMKLQVRTEFLPNIVNIITQCILGGAFLLRVR